MDFTDLLTQLEIPFRRAGESEHVTTKFIGIDCPFCGDSQEFHLGYHLTYNYLSCWQCGPRSVTESLLELTKLPLGQIKKLIEGLDTTPREIVRPKGKLTLPNGIGELRRAHRRYLKERGFDPDKLAKLWRIGGIGNSEKLSWRIFIPIYFGSEVVSWTTRSISQDSKWRYIGAKAHEEKIKAKTILYGEQLVRGHSIIVCEGPSDAWRIGAGSVATLGISYTRSQIARISHYPNRFIAFDNEPEAQRRARTLCQDLSAFPGKTMNVIVDAKDPGSCSPKEVKLLRRLLK